MQVINNIPNLIFWITRQLVIWKLMCYNKWWTKKEKGFQVFDLCVIHNRYLAQGSKMCVEPRQMSRLTYSRADTRPERLFRWTDTPFLLTIVKLTTLTPNDNVSLSFTNIQQPESTSYTCYICENNRRFTTVRLGILGNNR